MRSKLLTLFMAVAVVVALYMSAHSGVAGAQTQLDQAQQQHAALQSQLNQLHSVQDVYGQVAARQSMLSQAMGDDAPVVQLVQKLLTQALRDRASDIHIEPQDKALRVRFRVDGALHEVLSLPAAMSSAMVSRIKILAGMNIVERRRSQDGQIAINIDGRPVDIRVATTATICK